MNHAMNAFHLFFISDTSALWHCFLILTIRFYYSRAAFYAFTLPLLLYFLLYILLSVVSYYKYILIYKFINQRLTAALTVLTPLWQTDRETQKTPKNLALTLFLSKTQRQEKTKGQTIFTPSCSIVEQTKKCKGRKQAFYR